MHSDTDIELGIYSRTFKRSTLSGVLDAVVENRFEHVHLSLNSAGIDPFRAPLSAVTCNAIRTELAARSLSLVGVSCTFNAIHPDAAQRDHETGLAGKLIALAPELGTSFATLSTGTRDREDLWRSHPANDNPSAWSDLRRTLERLLQVARTANVTLGIEPEHNNVVSSASQARRLL